MNECVIGQSDEKDGMEKWQRPDLASSGASQQPSTEQPCDGPSAAPDIQHTLALHPQLMSWVIPVLQNRKLRLRRGSNLPKSYGKKAAELQNRIFLHS